MPRKPGSEGEIGAFFALPRNWPAKAVGGAAAARLAVLGGGDKFRERLAPHHHGGKGGDIDADRHVEHEAVEGFDVADQARPVLDLEKGELAVDESVDQVELVIRARRQPAVMDDAARRQADRALAPMQEIAARQVAVEGAVGTGGGRRRQPPGPAPPARSTPAKEINAERETDGQRRGVADQPDDPSTHAPPSLKAN